MTLPINLEEYEHLARQRLPAMVFDYFWGGAGDEVTLRENRAGWQQLRLRPRVLVDIQRFESTPGQMAAIDALCTIQRPSKEGSVSKTWRSSVQQPMAGQGYDALVSAHSRALAAISSEIAEAIRSFSPSNP